MNYPQHEKLAKIKEKSQTIGEFLEWLQIRKKIVLCKSTGDFHTTEYELYTPANINTQTILSEFFEIDLNKLEKEKIQMLKDLQIKVL
jgi:hypothetical protein